MLMVYKSFASDDMNLDRCIEHCKNSAFVGLTRGRDCYCGTALGENAGSRSDKTYCNLPCADKDGGLCGGRGSYVLDPRKSDY